jgi:predicted GIY-YIG superfamily endonuclease
VITHTRYTDRLGDKYWVYLHLATDGAVLYVGCTTRPRRRQATHKARSPWFADVAHVEYEDPRDREAALTREAELIKQLDPINNLVHTRRRTQTLNWKVGKYYSNLAIRETRLRHVGHRFGDCLPSCYVVASKAVRDRHTRADVEALHLEAIEQAS